MAPILHLVAFCIFIGLTTGVKSTCKKNSACSCTFPEGVIDLSKIPGLKDDTDSTPWVKDKEPSTGDKSYDYSYKPCYDFNEDGTVGGPCSSVASCQVSKDKKYMYPLGTSASAEFMEEDGEVKIKYESTDATSTRQTWVTLKCTSSESFEVKGEEGEASGKYVYILSSPYACKGGPGVAGGGISIGTILCIVLLVILVIYVVAGVLFMKFKKGAEGVEMVPNLTFWKELPLLVKEGACFSVSPITKRDTYSKM